MKKRFWKIFAIICAALIVTTVLTGVFYVVDLKKSDAYINFDKGKLNEVYTSLTILDNSGKVLEEPLYLNGYKQIPLDALHDYTYMAFVAVEDKRFFSHGGIDYRRVLGAVAHNIKSGHYKEGASTITQQLIKNTHLDNYKTLKRKVNEMLLAVELEKKYNKNEILEMYLNTIYFGRNAYGIETAANVYFNKSASELTVAESATLAGMIKAPNNYAPDKNADKCKQRRDVVLKLMLDQNVIDVTQYSQALQSDIVYSPQKQTGEKTYSYAVMQEACKLLNMTPLQLAKSNIIIETYCNQQAQKKLYELSNNDDTLTVNGLKANLACILCDNKGGVEACLFRGENAESKRQVGSALKPIAVYAPSLNEQIITQASPVLDEETDFNGYKPANAGGYNGWTTIKAAVAKSLNVPAVKTLNALGLSTAQKYLECFGIKGEQNLSLALGNANGGIDALTLAKCYATLANNGSCNETRFIKNIYSENGIVYSRELEEARVFQPRANYLMTDLLVNTVNCGTAKKLAIKNIQVAAKTGTVGNVKGNSDALVAGYTTFNTFVVWYSGELDNSVNGGTAPCVLAKSLLESIYEKDKPCNFVAPYGVEQIALDKEQLYDNQIQVIANNGGEVFLFEQANKPRIKAKEEVLDYKLRVDTNDRKVSVELPTCEGDWLLYSSIGGEKRVLSTQNGKSELEIDTDTQFYAELYRHGKLVYTTPTVEVCLTHDERHEQRRPSIKDYWYWK